MVCMYVCNCCLVWPMLYSCPLVSMTFMVSIVFLVCIILIAFNFVIISMNFAVVDCFDVFSRCSRFVSVSFG